MKNTIKFLGIIAFVAIIGFSFTACGGDDDNGGNGGGNLISAYRNTTWSDGTITIAFGTDKVTISGDTGDPNYNGTYTIPEAKNEIWSDFNRFYSFTSVIGNRSFSIYVKSDGKGVLITDSTGAEFTGFVKQK